MKRLVSLLIVCLLTAAMLCAIPVSAEKAGVLNVTANATTVTAGDKVTLTLKYSAGGQPIGGVNGTLKYDVNVFSYVSYTCSSGMAMTVSGDSGITKFNGYATDGTAPSVITVTFTFKSNAAGSGLFKVTTEEFFNDTDYASLGNPSGSVSVTANNPTLSGNANLKSLKPSKGTLNPKFNADVTDYTITVDNSVTSLSLSAVTSHNDARTLISGKNTLEVGQNVRIITVTAPNGNTKKYTVVITRQAAPSSTSGSNTLPGISTTVPLPPADALEVEVGGTQMTILDTQAAVDLPIGFVWGNVTINQVEVPAAINSQTGMTLLYLTTVDMQGNGFYIYDAVTDSFTPFHALGVSEQIYLLYNLPSTEVGFDNVVPGVLNYDGGSITAFVYEDAELKDFFVVWAAPNGGAAGWYIYDKAEGTFQRYHAAADTGDYDSDLDTPNRPANAPTASNNKKTKTSSLLSVLFSDYRSPMIIVVVAVVAIVAIILVFTLISTFSRNNKTGKH